MSDMAEIRSKFKELENTTITENKVKVGNIAFKGRTEINEILQLLDDIKDIKKKDPRVIDFLVQIREQIDEIINE